MRMRRVFGIGNEETAGALADPLGDAHIAGALEEGVHAVERVLDAAELVRRLPALGLPPETLVVVTCAGRTRSIIGAQSLINAGLPNPVRALRNGTIGWTLAGRSLELRATRRLPAPRETGWSRAAALRVAGRAGVRFIDRTGLA